MLGRKSIGRLGLLVLALALVAAACGGTEDTTTTAAEATTTTAEATTTTAEVTTTAEAGPDYGEPVTLTLGHPFGEPHPIHQRAMIPFAEAVNAGTDGTVTIEIVPGGAIAPPPGTYDTTVGGGQDLGWALQGYHAGVFPITEVVEIPFQFTSASQATATLLGLYDEFPELQEEYADTKVLALWTHDIGDFWTKERQIQTLEDFAGLTLRAPTPMMLRFIEGAGASAVGFPAPQIYDSLSTGVIDGLSIAVSGLQSFQLYDQLAFGTTCDCYVASQYLVMNLDVWNSLTPDTQAVIEAAGREMAITGGTVYDGAYVAISERADEAGIEKVDLSADELARWHAIGEEIAAGWLADMEAAGIDGQAIFDRMQELAAENEV